MCNMEFQYCLVQYSNFQRWGYGESVGDLQGDPMLIPSSSPGGCISTAQTGFGLLVKVWLQSVGDP